VLVPTLRVNHKNRFFVLYALILVNRVHIISDDIQRIIPFVKSIKCVYIERIKKVFFDTKILGDLFHEENK